MYYLLYADNCEMPSKAAFDPEEPSLGRIRADCVAPPHSLASIKRCISRVERTPELAHADLFADISCDTPLKDGHISILQTDCPGLSLNEPMAIVQMCWKLQTVCLCFFFVLFLLLIFMIFMIGLMILSRRFARNLIAML